MNEDQLTVWLKSELARCARISPKDVDIDEPMAGYGLDSLAAVSMAAELEVLLGFTLSPTLSWDYPTISQMAKFLSAQHLKVQTEKTVGSKE